MNNQREQYEEIYNGARKNLLLMILLTVVNMVLLVLDAQVMMLFSATLPYVAVAIGMAGYSSTALTLSVVFAIVIIGLYLLCWWLSKKHYGWMFFAFVLFVLDTVALVAIYVSSGEISGILDTIMHVWILFYLLSGCIHGYKLNHLPEEVYTSSTTQYPTIQGNDSTDSYALRSADEVKCRILLQSKVHGHEVVYRRVKRVNELVVDGSVYDEMEALVEKAHELCASIDGHTIQVGFDGWCHSFLKVDGYTVLKKIRWY